ncbi:MAG TPA: DNA primase [Longimicrobiales bacterium]|nr:DNA primase [Longimicrobiales bacterium]
MIPDHTVEEVRDRADIVEVIGEHVQLKRAGKEFKALCPFHAEKTPSFYVVPGKGFYKCFGCGESGDVFSFLMKHLGLSFNEAVEKLAQREGVEIPRAAARPEDDALRPYREALAFAADFYRRRLLDPDRGGNARRYLQQRGIDEAAAERFLLGYAPDAWRDLREAAHAHGMTDEVLETAGLIKTSEKMDEPYDRLRDRLIFPITDVRGRVIGFGGRVLSGDATGPKYLNSPETPLYHKGRELYGLHWSKGAIRRESAALVVEGYMDYVSLAARGVEHVVATLGTAMTPEQAALITRYTARVLILYDSDPAGLRATFRSGDEILRAGGHPMVVTLPPGEDPDSVARAGGAEALQPYLEDAVDVLERKLQILEERGYFEDVEGVRKALDGLLPTLRAAKDPTLQDIYVDRVARRTGVRRETLEGEIREASGGSRRVAAQRIQRPARTMAGESPGRPGRDGAEQLLLLLMVRDPGRIRGAVDLVPAGEIRGAVNRELYEALGRGGEGVEDLAALPMSAEAGALLEQLRGDRTELSDPDRVFWEQVETIRLRPQLERLDELQARLAEADASEHAALFAEKTELKRKLKEKATEMARLGAKVSNRYRRYLKR